MYVELRCEVTNNFAYGKLKSCRISITVRGFCLWSAEAGEKGAEGCSCPDGGWLGGGE